MDSGKTEAQAIQNEIQRYLLTGETDGLRSAWSGDWQERFRRGHADLRGALVGEIKRRASGRKHVPVPDVAGPALTRAKVEAMVRGLFPRSEHHAVLSAVERSVVFVTSANIDWVLNEQRFDHSAWTIANLYLACVGADLLNEDAPLLVGMSQETTCYVSPQYFAEDDPFADFVIHEVAHIFHNCKRATVGLRHTRTRQWLLDIEFRKRETFAYSCEAYARVLDRAQTRAERRAFAEEYGRKERIAADGVDPSEVASILKAAVEVRNGWKIILTRCAPPRCRDADPDTDGGP